MFFVYAMILRSDPQRFRYVGLTTQSLEQRFKNHLKTVRSGRKLPVHWWIAKHGPDAVDIVLLGSFESVEDMKAFEISEISRLRAIGQADLNITDGGESASGYRHTPETRAKMSEMKLASPTRHSPSPEHRKAVGDANRARLADPVEKAKHAERVGKLKGAQVLEIKHAIWSGKSNKEIASEWSVSYQTINNISRNVAWTHVPWPVGPRCRSQDLIDFLAKNNGSGLRASKLDAQKVREIREGFSQGVSGASLARKYGVSPATITNIRKGLVWHHVTD